MNRPLIKRVGKVESVYKLWLSAKETKAYLDCSDEFLKKLRDKAVIVFSLAEGKYYYNLDSINKFLNQNKVI